MSGTTTQSSVDYHVHIKPKKHEIDVKMALAGPVAMDTVRVENPTWVPGDYEFQPFGRDVFNVQATDKHGNPLPVHREGWQAYNIFGGAGAVRITYTAYCGTPDFSESCGILNDENGVLLGTRYLFAPAHLGVCHVTYELPAGWQLHHPAGAEQRGEWTWQYPSYEILLDTPVVVGKFDNIVRQVNGTNFYHIFLNRSVGFESEAENFVKKLVPVAESYHEIFGSFPFDNYTYIFSLNPTEEWGLEHLTSTMIGLGPDVFVDPDQNAIGVRTCAHEFFHAWNVRRLRPAPLDRLNFYRGSFTEGLWMAEGFTRYYEFLTCTRTGVYSPPQFFSAVVNYYRHLTVLPAYFRVSAVDSSYASYLNHPKYPGNVNSAIDYYDKGMLIGFGLDAVLRSNVPGGSLDRAFSTFYKEYVGQGLGYTTKEVIDFFDGILPGLGEQLAVQVEKPGGLPLVEQLTLIGFAVEEETIPYMGLIMQDNQGPGIFGVLDTSPAGRSGIAPEDVVTAVNGYPYSLAALKWIIAHKSEITLHIQRGNQLHTYMIPIGERTQISKLTWAGNAEQASRISAWLGQDFQPAPGQEFPLDFYENFHGVETVI